MPDPAIRRRLTPMVLLALAWLLPAGDGRAAPPTSGTRHAARCCCGAACRGGKCCCDQGSVPPAPRPEPDAEPAGAAFVPVIRVDDASACPCVESRPCHGPGLPSVPPGAAGAADALASSPGSARLADGAAFPSPASQSTPSRRASRLDRPPDA